MKTPQGTRTYNEETRPVLKTRKEDMVDRRGLVEKKGVNRSRRGLREG